MSNNLLLDTIKGTQKIIKEKGLNYISSLSRPLELVEVNLNYTEDRVSPKNKINLKKQFIKERQSLSFNEVDGQFSMFSDEPTTKRSEQVNPEPTFESISKFLCQTTVSKNNKAVFKKILLSIDKAIGKRA